LAAVALAVSCLAGCASAQDVASVARTDAVHQTNTERPSTPQAPTTSDPSTPLESTPPSTTSGPTGSSQSPRPPQTARRHLPNIIGGVPVFLTPSRNIGCAIGAGQARCDIAKHVYRDPPKPAGCHGDYGQSIAVTAHGIASFLCVTDTVRNPGAPVLDYGTSTVVGDFGCTSRQSGIRCYHLESDHGFWLSQEHPALF
jgi:hypothetical protein